MLVHLPNVVLVEWRCDTVARSTPCFIAVRFGPKRLTPRHPFCCCCCFWRYSFIGVLSREGCLSLQGVLVVVHASCHTSSPCLCMSPFCLFCQHCCCCFVESLDFPSRRLVRDTFASPFQRFAMYANITRQYCSAGRRPSCSSVGPPAGHPQLRLVPWAKMTHFSTFILQLGSSPGHS